MRLLRKMCFIALMSGLAIAQTSQTSASNPNSDPSNLADQVKQLQQTMVEQQKAMAEQQKQLADQQKELERLRQRVGAQSDSTSASNTESVSEPQLVNASLTSKGAAGSSAQPVSTAPAQETERKESPLSFRIGGAEFTPGGFMDFTAIFRSTNTGNPGGTNFFAVPFSNTVAGHLTENRFTAQNSRLTLKVTDKFGKNDVMGYVELDFLGNDAANVEVTSNSHTLRQRLYWASVRRDKWEVVAGQMWGWLTPNRTGLSSYTPDVFYTLDMDFNYQVGLTWTRQPGVRFIYHPNENWAMGVSLENPEQFGGQGEITFPAAFNAQLGGQIDSANISSTPNLHPDIIPKIAYDTNVGGKHFHVEAAGLLSSYKITDLAPSNTAGASFVKHTVQGGGVEGAINLEVFKNFHLVANGFWSDGGGRYIFGMAPDLVVLPTNAPGTTCAITGVGPAKTAVGCDARISAVHTYSGIGGFEYAVTPHTTIYGYYGGMYAQRNFGVDITSTAAAQPFIGFGGPNSANNNNRSVQEPSVGWIQTFWRNPQYGALQLITQASYITRAPWFVAAGAPKNAHLAMGWVDLRYVLP